MDKRLLEQVQRALQAQEDTIQRQQQMLDMKDEDIAQLTGSLKALAETQAEAIEVLPSRLVDLVSSTEVLIDSLNKSNQTRKEEMQVQATLAAQLIALSDSQMSLIQLMNSYQSTVAPPDKTKSMTKELETILSTLKTSQTTIMTAQEEIKRSQSTMNDTQQLLQKELSELDRLRMK